ncbi:hypothetical protein [Microcella sp.]|uniref:hypothetical protein n=1 Tax=Microcella sp. TaxID=1913979 RepID=UPI00256A8B5F|nr:hypothetical protein [Microcella sp.]MBX9472674.1 hypothetical protein [Microcella sp.]
MTDSSSGSSVLDRLAAAPSRTAGVVAAALALAMMLIGAVVLPSTFVAVPDGDQVDGLEQLASNTVPLLLGNVLAFLGFLPLLTAVHALMGTRATPASLMLAAYLVLLARPLALGVEAAAFPDSVLIPLGPLVPYLLLATTGLAAALASAAIVPLAQAAASPVRRAVLAAGIGVLVALALFSFAPFIAPLATLGIGVALLMRKRGGSGYDPANGPAGQH